MPDWEWIRKLLRDLAKLFKIGENLKILTKVISKKKVSATEKNLAFDALAFILLPLVLVIALIANSFQEVVPLYLKLAFSSTIVCVVFSSIIEFQTMKQSRAIEERDVMLLNLYTQLKEIESKKK